MKPAFSDTSNATVAPSSRGYPARLSGTAAMRASKLWKEEKVGVTMVAGATAFTMTPRGQFVGEVLERRVHTGTENRRDGMPRHRLLHAGRCDDAAPTSIGQDGRNFTEHVQGAFKLIA